MRAADLLAVEDSLERAAHLLQEGGCPLLPVNRGGALAGVVSEKSLANALGRGCSPHDSVENALEPAPRTISSHESGAEALRVLNEEDIPALVVLDPNRRVIGVVAASDLF